MTCGRNRAESLNGPVWMILQRGMSMCECGCTNPKKKAKDPKECSPEQIAECHPEAKGAGEQIEKKEDRDYFVSELKTIVC